MWFQKKEKSADTFWKEFEEKTGEKVLARSLGRYVSGWEGFDCRGRASVWGLIIASSGGFRFHHFPQKSWLDNLANFGGESEPKEKTIYIPGERILAADIIAETAWWKKIFSPAPPRLLIRYRDDGGNERVLELEVSYSGSGGEIDLLTEKLRPAKINME